MANICVSTFFYLHGARRCDKTYCIVFCLVFTVCTYALYLLLAFAIIIVYSVCRLKINHMMKIQTLAFILELCAVTSTPVSRKPLDHKRGKHVGLFLSLAQPRTLAWFHSVPN
jgi:hypothetical protein